MSSKGVRRAKKCQNGVRKNFKKGVKNVKKMKILLNSNTDVELVSLKG